MLPPELEDWCGTAPFANGHQQQRVLPNPNHYPPAAAAATHHHHHRHRQLVDDTSTRTQLLLI